MQECSELVARIQTGDPEAEAALYARYAARVYHVALRELRARDRAEDVRAETFLRVLQALRQNRLRTPAALPGFILETTHNVIREQFRREQRADAVAREELERLRRGPPPEVVTRDVQRAIEDAIRTLKPRDRLFLKLYFYDELPRAAIAERLKLKEEQIRLIKSRALKRFREAYERLTR